MIRYVLSVGGARGSFQAGALWRLHVEGLTGGHYYGHSVGALNGVICAMGGWADMLEVWETIKDKDVYRHKFGAARAGWAAVTGQAMLDTEPLMELVNRQTIWRKLEAEFTTGFVDLEDGLLRRKTYLPGRPRTGIERDVYASAAIPFAFPLIDHEADGGLIEPVPLNPAIEDASDDDVIVIISCHPIGKIAPEKQSTGAFGRLSRTLEIMQHTLTQRSVEPFLLINRLAAHGDLTDPATGRVYRKFKSVIIAPQEPLPWGMLDFSGSHAGVYMGIAAAEQAIANLKALI